MAKSCLRKLHIGCARNGTAGGARRFAEQELKNDDQYGESRFQQHGRGREPRDCERDNESVRYFAANPTGIDRRLRELDEEWDIERLLKANASALIIAGVALGVTVDKRWIALPALVGHFYSSMRSKDGVLRSRFCGGAATGPRRRLRSSGSPSRRCAGLCRYRRPRQGNSPDKPRTASRTALTLRGASPSKNCLLTKAWA